MKNTRLTDLKFIAIQFLLLATFGLASLSKWREGGVPDHFYNQFGETWLSMLPGGLIIPFYSIAITETAVVVLVLISLFRAEWLQQSKKLFLRSALVLTLFIFVMLGYGLRLIGEFGGTANLYFYFGCTLIGLYITEKSVPEISE